MKISEIVKLLDAKPLCGADSEDLEVMSASASDMMSDVLAFVKDQSILITGLMNVQVVRTAEMLDVACVVFVRGKRPTPDIIDMAVERDMCILSTHHTLYVACGILYQNGLPGGPGKK